MQRVAAWLVARPLNGVVALAVSASLPIVGFVSNIFLAHIAIRSGAGPAVLQALAAAAFLLVASLIGGSEMSQVLAALALPWGGTLLLCTLMARTRSLILTLQVSVIAVVALLMITTVATDPQATMAPLVDHAISTWEAVGRDEIASQIAEQRDAIVLFAAVFLFPFFWLFVVACFLAGYQMTRLSGPDPGYGRFREVNFGKVLATILALVSVVSLFVESVFVLGTALVLMVVFFVQGLAIIHWANGNGFFPFVGVVAIYAALIFPPVFPAIAVLGYVDAWFGLRRFKATQT